MRECTFPVLPEGEEWTNCPEPAIQFYLDEDFSAVMGLCEQHRVKILGGPFRELTEDEVAAFEVHQT